MWCVTEKDAQIKKFQYQRERAQSRQRHQHQERDKNNVENKRHRHRERKHKNTKSENANNERDNANTERDNANTERDTANTERDNTTARDTETNSKRDRHKHQARQRQTPNERHTNTYMIDMHIENIDTHQEIFSQTPRLLHLWSWTFSCELLTRRNSRCGSNQRWLNLHSNLLQNSERSSWKHLGIKFWFFERHDWTRSAEEPSFSLRTAFSELPLVSDMGIGLSWCHKCSPTQTNFK